MGGVLLSQHRLQRGFIASIIYRTKTLLASFVAFTIPLPLFYDPIAIVLFQTICFTRIYILLEGGGKCRCS